MNDIESQVFTRVSDVLTANFRGITVKSELELSPSKFPSVSLEEADNYSLTSTATTTGTDNHQVVMYELNVLSNKSSGRKSEAKKIFSMADEVLVGLGFTRLSRMPMPMNDGTVYRYVGRYTAVVDNNQNIYRR